MKDIHDHSFHDGKILSISIFDNYVEVLFEKWDCTTIKVCFDDYYAIKDFHSIGQDTIELSVNISNEILAEAKQNILDGGGSEEEAAGLNSYSFIDSWQEKRIFEIAAKNVRVEEFVRSIS